MTGPFFFIDGMNPSSASKRGMRQHVMKGKNAGRILHRTSRSKQQLLDRKHSSRDTGIQRGKPVAKVPGKYMHSYSIMVPRNLGNDLSACWVPVEVTGDSLEAIHDFFAFTSQMIYSPELGLSMEEAKVLWLPTMFADESTFQCTIDIMKTCNDIFLHGTTTVRAMQHISRTFAHVKKKLESDDTLSDGTIMTIMSLVSQEMMQQQHTAAKVHAEGMQKIVELRGGLDKLEPNIGLIVKICKTDVVLALQHGGHTVYFRDRIDYVEKRLATKGLLFDRASVTHLSDPYIALEGLEEVFVDIMAFCRTLNTVQPGVLDLVTYQEALLSMFYRLLRLRSLSESRKFFDDCSAMHLGLIMFLMTIFLHHGDHKILDFELAGCCLKTVIEHASILQHDQSFLWLLVIGGIWTAPGTQASWLENLVTAVAVEQNIKTWRDLRGALQNLPWINVIHDRPGKLLWERMHSIP